MLVTEEELHITLKQMKLRKSFGLDCFSAQYYKSFEQSLLILCELSTPFSTSPTPFLEAHMSVLPKAGKAPCLVPNYRPISLLNIDAKLFAKILANRLLPLIPSLMAPCQVSFVLGREAHNSTLKVVNICLVADLHCRKGLLPSIDG